MVIWLFDLYVKTRVENDSPLKDIENLSQLMTKVDFDEGLTSAFRFFTVLSVNCSSI